MSTIDDVLRKLASWETSIKKIDKLDTIEQQLSSLQENVNALNERVSLVEYSQHNNNTEVQTLKADLNCAISELNELKQESLSNEFVIYGLPPQISNEHAKGVVQHFATATGVQISDNDIQFAFARHIKRKSESIIVGRFKQLAAKQAVMKSFAEKKPIPVKSVINDLEETLKQIGKELVIRNQLTPFNRKIMSEAHKINNGTFRFIWDSNGRIMLKKTELDRAIHIRSMALVNEMSLAQRTQV